MRWNLCAIVVSVGLQLGCSLQAQTAADANLNSLIQALGSGNTTAAVKAADAVADLGTAGKDAVPALVALLEKADEETLWHVERALGSIGSEAGTAVPALTAKLQDKSPKVRAYAAYALGRIGEAAKPAVPALVTAVKDPEATVRREAVKAVRAIKPGPEVVIPLAVEMFKSAQPAELVPALQSIAESGEKGLPVLVESFKHPEARYWACLLLSELGPRGKEAVPAAIEVLKDERPEVRREAVLALGRVGPDAAAAVPAIASALDDKDPTVRYAAAYALGNMGPAAKEAVATLTAKTSDSDEFLRTIATWAVARLDPANDAWRKKAVPLLVAALQHKDARIRGAAAHALADLFTGDSSVTEAFIARLNDQDHGVGGVVANALVELGEPAVPALIKALDNKDLRGYAVATLGRIGPKAAAAIGPLTATLADELPAIRRETLFAIGAIAPADPTVIAALAKSLDGDKDGDVRSAAAEALGLIGPGAASAVPTLQKALQDGDQSVREAAAEALKKIQK